MQQLCASWCQPPDLLCLTEHWLQEEEPLIVPNFTCVAKFCRNSGLGGGVLIYLNNLSSKSKVSIKSREDLAHIFCNVTCFECSIVQVKLFNPFNQIKHTNFILICLYRAPKNNVNNFITAIERLIHRVVREKLPVLICGDWNIDFLNKENKDVEHLRNVFQSFNITELVKEPTRITHCTKSLLDNVVTNLKLNNIICKSFFNGISDHDAQLITVKNCTMQNTNILNKRVISRSNTLKFYEILDQIDWSFLDSISGVNEKFESFFNVLNSSFLRSFPLEMQKGKRNNKNRFQISAELKKFADKNVDIAILLRDSGDPWLKALLKTRKKIFSKRLLEEKRAIISGEILNSSNRQKTVWNVVRRETRETTLRNITSLVHKGSLVESHLEIANLFSNLFSFLPSVTNSSPLSVPVGSSVNTHQLIPPVTSLFFSPVTSVEIEQIIMSLKSSNSTGVDEISSTLLKQIYKTILNPLTSLFNISISSGIYPDVYKTSKLIPIFKKGDRSEVNNYRPVSLLCTISKVLERVVNNRLLHHLNNHNIIVPNQYGFRKNRSTTEAIKHFIKEIIHQLENRQPAVGLFCDLSKAFDRVDHGILLRKLENCGVRGVPLSWFESYLSDRRQFVEWSNTQSDFTRTECGVPQGSILGPLLFLIYINDIVRSLPLANITLFADDTSLLFGGPQDNLENRVSGSLCALQRWLLNNNLMLNHDKTVYMQFLTRNKCPLEINFDEFAIKECSTTNFLGLTVDNKLSWSIHISKLCGKLSRVIYALRTLYPLLEPDALLMVYHGCFSSIMSYGIELWGGSPHAFKAFLEQKRAVRVIKGLSPLSSCRGVFRDLNILTLPSLFIFKMVMSMVDQTHDIQTVGAEHRYPTRHGNDLRIPRLRLALGEQGSEYCGALFFNSLPANIRIGKEGFRKRVKAFLVEREFYSIREFLCNKD